MVITKPSSAKERIILALDVDTLDSAVALVDELKDYVGFFKIGLPLFTTCGVKAIEAIKAHGGKLYLDTKFHDIPHIVAKACSNLIKKDVNFFNVHIQGGSKMLSALVQEAKSITKELNVEPATIIGVGLLSSFGQRTLTEELCVEKNIDEYSLQLAIMAKKCGLNGIVAGANETLKIRREVGDDFLIISPAIRPTWAAVNDQVRVDTPMEAIKAGVDYLVIGRPIIEAEDKIAAINLIIDEINSALECPIEV